MQKNKKLNFILLKPNTNTDKSKVIVAFHGWGGNKDSFLAMAKNRLFQNFTWYLPEAPYLVDNNQNQRSWSYEIEENVWETENIGKLLNNFFDSEIFKNHDSKNVYVIGFSQGALVCYEFICKLNQPLGGIFPISGFMRSETTTLHPSQKNTPIIIGHGTRDNIVSVEKSKTAYQHLKACNANVDLITYDTGHRISIEIINKIVEMIEK